MGLLRRTMLNFPLFHSAPRAFKADIARAHLWVQCLPGDLVVEEGQVVQEMVFIIHGRILLQHIRRWSKTPANGVPPGEDELELESGAWWGEACFFEQGRVRDFNAFAAVESELAVLPAHEYHRVLQLYPQQAALHRALEQGILSGRLSLDDLAL